MTIVVAGWLTVIPPPLLTWLTMDLSTYQTTRDQTGRVEVVEVEVEVTSPDISRVWRNRREKEPPVERVTAPTLLTQVSQSTPILHYSKGRIRIVVSLSPGLSFINMNNILIIKVNRDKLLFLV